MVGFGEEDSGKRKSARPGEHQDRGGRKDPARNQSALPFRDVVSAFLLGWGTDSEVPAPAPTATTAAIMPVAHVGAEMPPTQRQACQSGQSGDLRAARRRPWGQSVGAGKRCVRCLRSSRAPCHVVMTSHAGRRVSFVNPPLVPFVKLEAGITATLISTCTCRTAQDREQTIQPHPSYP